MSRFERSEQTPLGAWGNVDCDRWFNGGGTRPAHERPRIFSY